MRLLHAVESLAPAEGGPPRVVASLVAAQRALGIEAHVLCDDTKQLPGYLQHWQRDVAGFSGGWVVPPFPLKESLAARYAALRSWLTQHVADYDVVHIHQLWRLVPSLTGLVCRRLQVPYLVAPHTSMSPWALAQSGLKKKLSRALMWNRIFSGAAGFHALNELEAADIRACMGTGGPEAFVVSNGVSLEEFSGVAPAGAAPLPGELSAPEGGSPFILFLARLHTMKGPDLLLEAFAKIAPACAEAKLVFAGPDFGMLATLRKQVAQLRLQDRVRFLGLVSGPQKKWLLENALCLAQPSRDEGFSLSILEGLACARPVVISDRCKFPQVALHGAGIVVPLSIDEIAAALHVYASSPERGVSDGRSGRQLVEQRFTWDVVAKQTVEMYSQVISARAHALDHAHRL